VTSAFVVGYDPGGIDKHGVAVLQLESADSRWRPVELRVTTAHTLAGVVAWATDAGQGGCIVAAGVDTLTEWNSGPAGWRPADEWLRREYPAVKGGVISPAGLFGAMVINGAGLLVLLTSRFRMDNTMITEAHPKVCYYACTGRRANWKNDRDEMASWLVRQLNVAEPDGLRHKEDHRFDAAMSALAALRGLNGDWTLDLHALPTDTRVQPVGQTHFWWPSPNGKHPGKPRE
jgi:hypothetical protein